MATDITDIIDTGFPSTRQIQNLIREKKTVEVKLVTGDLISGQVRWQDPQCLAITTPEGAVVQIWFHAIAFIKPQ